MDRNVNRIVLTTVTMTLAMLCLVYVYLVVEKDGWAHSVNNIVCVGKVDGDVDK
jgi:hypothetical protein